jgi:hypothetical protein
MVGSQQRLALTLVLVDFGKLGLQVFKLALKRGAMSAQQVQEAFELWRGIARGLIQIQDFADFVESEP